MDFSTSATPHLGNSTLQGTIFHFSAFKVLISKQEI